MEPRTKKLRFCSPSKKGSCPRLYTCQFSPSLKKNICCGRSGGSIDFISFPGNGTDNGDNIITRINQIANIINPDPSNNMGGGMLSSKNEICEKGEPYILNGVAQTCTSTVCPNKYHCVFSKAGKNYYCCSREGAGVLVSIFN